MNRDASMPGTQGRRVDRNGLLPAPPSTPSSGCLGAAGQYCAVLRSAARVAHIASILAVSSVVELRTLAAAAGARDADAFRAALGRASGRTLWRLGPAFVKLGQLLSTRPDLLGPELSAELRYSLALGAGAPVPDAMASSEIKSGSVAEVRRVELAGTALAVKSIRPGVPAVLDRDTALMEAAARLLEHVSGGLPVAAITSELCAAVRRQASLEHELACLRLLSGLRDSNPVVIPCPLERYSSSRHLVMTWLDGQDDPCPPEPSHAASTDPRAVARHLTAAVFEMLFVTGAVHCDLHPGNWWTMPDGRIAIVDAGFVVTLDDRMRGHFARFFLGLATGNGDVCADEALAVAVVPPSPPDQTTFRAEMRRLVSQFTGRSAGRFSLIAFATDFFNIQRRCGAISRSDFVFPITALLVIEGQVQAMDPDLDFQALARTTLIRALATIG